jgi:hypothetical protein
MPLVSASSLIYGNARVVAVDSIGKARGAMPQAVKSFFKVNGEEITAHNRSFSSSIKAVASSVTLASGKSKRFYVRSPKAFSLSFSYVPGPSAMSVDGQGARDFLFSIATLDKNVLVEYLPEYTSDQDSFDYESVVSRVTGYSETLIRRDESNGCYYYNVSISFEGV